MRRFFSVLLTLAVAAAVVLLVDTATRGLVRDELTERLPEVPDRAAAELAELTRRGVVESDDGALTRLVEAATSEVPNVAAAGQKQIDRLLGEWQFGREQLSGERLRKRLATIAAGLRASGLGDDPDWAASTARKLLRLANAAPNASAPVSSTSHLVDDCDAVLAAAAIAPRPRPVRRPAPQTVQALPPVPPAIEPSPAPTLAPTAKPLHVANAPADPIPTPTQKPAERSPLVWRGEARPSRLTPVTQAPSLASPPADAPPAGETDWGPNWAPPVSSPVASVNQPETFSLPPSPESFADLTDRELLRRFLPIAAAAQKPLAVGPNGPTASDITPEDLLRQAVVRRGYGGVATRHVQQLFSADLAQRRALVDRLLTARTGGAARMLLLLAADESPAVRHSAIRALGSSTNPQLVEAAWRMAVEDRDPRVARLAHELRGSANR